MNSSSYQAPAHQTWMALPPRRVIRTAFRRWQRMVVCGINLESTRFATIDARRRSWSSRREHRIERCGFVLTEVLRVLVVRHYSFLMGRIWHGNWRTCPTSTGPLTFGLTRCPKVGKLIVSSYQPSRQTGLGYSLKASLLTERGFRACKPNSNYTLPLTYTDFHIYFRLFRFCRVFAGTRQLVACQR